MWFEISIQDAISSIPGYQHRHIRAQIPNMKKTNAKDRMKYTWNGKMDKERIIGERK